jgi:hypothetical protein
MIRLLCLIFVGDWHRHKWVILGQKRLYESCTGEGLPYATNYHLQCAHCGDVKSRKL